MTQRALPLHDGHCCGPLFAPPAKRRPPRRIGPNDHGRIRRAAERRATPPWADRLATRALYNEVYRRNAAEGYARWSVEHLVPLQHPLVCGLHWHGNMVITELATNMVKSNLHWPDEWEQQLEMFDAD